MCSKELLVVACWGLLLGGLRLTSTTTTTTFVAAMSISNPDLERYFRSTNISQPFTTMAEERIAMDLYTYAFLNYSYGSEKSDFGDEKARYGEGKIATVHGKLVHISNANDLDDDYACTPNILGTRGTPTPPNGVQWIALVRRGRCTFEEKVKNVYEFGASGVIVYNDKIVMNLEKMQIKGKSRNITAVITYQEIGLELALKVDEGNDVYCSIIEGRSGMRPINSLNRTSVLFVSISFIVLMVISLVWLIFYYIQRFRYLQTKDQQSRQLCSVTKKAIMKIPTKTGKSSDEKDIDSDCCAICIEAYKASDCIRVLPCKHEFHKNCIDPWLIEHRTCPMCKLDVLKFYGYVVGDQIYTTPSPQHIPPNIAPVDDNDVPVVVIAIPHSTPQSQSQQQSSMQPQSEQGHSLQTSLIPSSSATTQLETTSTNSISSRCHSRNHSCTISNSSHHNQHQHQQEHQQQYQHHHSQHSNKNCRGYCSANSSDNSNFNQNNERSIVEPLMQNNRNGNRSGEETRRNSAPQLMQVSTASRQFLGSEESILEYDADRTGVARARNDGPAAGLNTALVAHTDPNRGHSLSNLIRGRDFVIDFPRIFVLEAGTTSNTTNTEYFPTRLPERSQSSLSLTYAKDWMSMMSNKLEEQHGGQPRMPKTSARFQMQENLLGIRVESVRKRRSRSADGRISNGLLGRVDLIKQQAHQKDPTYSVSNKTETITNDIAVLRRNSDAIYDLTEASYAESKQRRHTTRRSSDIELGNVRTTKSLVGGNDDGHDTQPTDVNITIQVNGEGVKLDEEIN